MLCRIVLGSAGAVTVRDQLSAERAARLGVVATVDDDLAYEYLATRESSSTWSGDPYVLAAPAASRFSVETWVDDIVRASEESGVVNIVVAATEVLGRRSDIDVCGQLVEALKSTGGLNVQYQFYAGDVGEYTFLIERAAAVVAARYHVLLVAKYFGRPIYPVVYHDKVAELLRQRS